MTAEAVAHGARRRSNVKYKSAAGGARGWLARAVAWLLMLLVAGVATFGMATTAHATDDDDLGGVMSFYALASSTSSFLGNSLSPDNNEGRKAMWDQVTKDAASGGAMLGYSDKNRNDGADWLSSFWTAASHTMSYQAFNVKEEGGGDAGSARSDVSDRLTGVIDYTHFGATLSGLGLDKTKTGLGLGFMNFIGGGIVLLLFMASHSVSFVFSTILSVLSTLNPFRLFYPAMEAINPEFAEGMVGGDTSGLPAGLAGVADFISQWYGLLNNLSWTVMVPIFMAVLVVSLAMFKNLNKGGAVKKFLIRLTFIGLGLPLVGSMYTGALTAMESATAGDNEGSSRVVASTFVDFESWVFDLTLGFPDEAVIEWNARESRPTDHAFMSVRSTALAINKRANYDLGSVGQAFDESGSWAEQVQGDGGNTSSSFSAIRDLLDRYMKGNTITASDYETQVKGVLNTALSKDGTPEARTRVAEWFTEFKDSKKLNDDGLADKISNNNVLVVMEDRGLKASPKGATYGVKKFSSNGTRCGHSVTGASSCNLAPLAMYNYLNTTFGSDSYTVYSAANSTSGATREVHNSVNLVGTGLMSMVYWLNAVVLLGAFVTIGFGYALGMAISNIRRTLQIITAIPFATLGALAGIAKVVVYSLALILELLITIFLYMMVQEFLVSLPQIIEKPFALALNTGSPTGADPGTLVGGVSDVATGAATIMTGSSVAMIVGLITVVVTIMFTIMALRLRKTLVKAVDEAITKIVNKFMDTSAGAPGGGGKMMPALAGGMAAGAGAAAMNKAMGGSPKGPKSNAGGINGSGAAPTTVGTDGGGTGQAGPDGGGTFEVEGSAEGAEGADGTGQQQGGQGADGQGSGSSVETSGSPTTTQVSSDSETTEKGKDVAANGLSDPTAKPVKGDATAAAGANQDDAMSNVAASAEDSTQKYKEADQAKVGVATEGAKAVGHGAVAAGAAAAGDAKTATEHGGKAVAAGAEAKAQAHESKAKADEAGRSSLDKPSSGKHAQKAQQARNVGQAAGAVGQAAGAANGGKGGKGGSTAGGASKAPSAPKPSSGGSKPSPQTPKAPQAGSSRRQQAPRQAPAPRQASAPAPRQQAPAPKPAPAPQPRPQAPAKPAPAPAPRAPKPGPAPKGASSPGVQGSQQQSRRGARKPGPQSGGKPTK